MIIMTDDHWEMVQLVHDLYEDRRTVPEARTILKSLKLKHGPDKGTRKYLYRLFPHGYAQQACKVAGMRIPLKLMLDL